MKTKILSVFMAVLFCICLTSCSKTLEVETGIKYSVYENDGKDMVSFYLTSDVDRDDVWKYDLKNIEALKVEFINTTTESNASYITVALSAKAEGEDILTFTLDNGTEKEFLVKCKKDGNGVLRITVAVYTRDESSK
jgi:uncharacterized cupredoxin-like copper-binding protein